MENEIVLPGQILTIAEEYIAGNNTFEDDKGNIRSLAIGIANFDENEREVSVQSKSKKVRSIRKGDVVIGRVDFINSAVVVLKIFEVENGAEVSFRDSRATIAIARASSSYLKNLSDEFKIGDIVKATVTQVTPYSIELETSSMGMGVIKAFCEKCRSSLSLFGEELKCNNCGKQNHRLIIKDYGKN